MPRKTDFSFPKEEIELKLKAKCKRCGGAMFRAKTYCNYCQKFLEWYENKKEVWAIDVHYAIVAMFLLEILSISKAENEGKMK